MFDAFISHAWEDKEDFVRPLARTLAALGANVWYDEFALKLGDSLSKSLDKGLAELRFGIAVLSRSFLQKNWTDYELRSLLSREVSGGKKVIIPILHGITPSELVEFSPYLADKISLQSEANITRVACRIIEVIRPDVFERIMRRIAYLEMTKKFKVETIETSKILISPYRHSKLPVNLVTRICLIRAALFEVYPHSMDFWVDGFRRDAHPSREVRIWEHISACYLEFVSAHELTAKQRSDAYNAITSLSLGGDAEAAGAYCKDLPSGAFDDLTTMWSSDFPIYDIEGDDFERVTGGEVAKSERPLEIEKMKEHFPYDVPDELIAELIDPDEDADADVEERQSASKANHNDLVELKQASEMAPEGIVKQSPNRTATSKTLLFLGAFTVIVLFSAGVWYWGWF